MKKLIALLIIALLALSACGSQNGIAHSQFSSAERVAYDFAKGMYSGNKDKQFNATQKFAGKDSQTQMIMNSQIIDGIFKEHYSNIKVMKLIKIQDNKKWYRYVLIQLTNDEGSRENILSVYGNKVQIVLAPNDKVFKKTFEEYRKKF